MMTVETAPAPTATTPPAATTPAPTGAASPPSAPSAPAPAAPTTLLGSTPAPTTDTGKDGAKGVEQQAAEGQKSQDGKTGAEAKAGDAPVPDIEVKLPDGVEPETVSLGEFKSMAKEAGLSSESAQKILDLHLKTQTSLVEKAQAAWKQQLKGWEDESRTDKEFGGDGLKASLSVAQRAIEKFGSPAFKKFLDESGFGNHPEMIRFVVKAGKALSEDSVAGPSAPGPTATDRQADLEVLYPSMFPKE